MTIDAHVHIWDLTRAQYPWLTPEAGNIYRSVEFSQIEPELDARGIGGAILVQASDESADTRVMIDAALQHPRIMGVVAWTPLDSPDQVALDVAAFARQPIVVGVRNLVHERPAGWVRRPEVLEGLGILAGGGYPLDLPTAAHPGLADVVWLGEQLPQLAIVIDHLGKPPIGGTIAQRDEWRGLLADCASNPAAVAKLSGLYSATGVLDSWTVEGVRPFVDDAIELFGAERLLYGGDWPISELAGGYARTWDAMTELLDPLSQGERDSILEGTARHVYLRERQMGSAE